MERAGIRLERTPKDGGDVLSLSYSIWHVHVKDPGLNGVDGFRKAVRARKGGTK